MSDPNRPSNRNLRMRPRKVRGGEQLELGIPGLRCGAPTFTGNLRPCQAFPLRGSRHCRAHTDPELAEKLLAMDAYSRPLRLPGSEDV
jgi:hypothetical protein